jgi:hypothetical protein
VLTVEIEAKRSEDLGNRLELYLNEGWHVSDIIFNSIKDKYVLLFTRNDWVNN